MPKMSDTMTEGVIAKWHKKVGDAVKSGELLAEVQTDKATMEFESFYDGGGDPSKISKLYKIAKAILGPELDPEDAGDTDDFVNRKAILELLHGVKKLGPNAGKPKLVIANYKYIKRKKAQAKPDVEQDITDIDDIPF